MIKWKNNKSENSQEGKDDNCESKVNLEFIDVANMIGRELCNRTFWSGKQCNWIGRTFSSNSYGKSGRNYRNENHALGPELYDGTSGIALFLSQLYRFTKNEEYYKTAEAAATQALLHVEQIPFINRFGYYKGIIGVAYVAAKIGKMFHNNRLLENAWEVLENLCLSYKETHLLDIMSGNAGAIPALFDIYSNIFHEEKIYSLASYLGKELMSLSVKEAVGWSWDSKSNNIPNTDHNLIGFAHGAAGIGFSLLELYSKTGLNEYLCGAENAFAYENQWFDQHNDNWPDFRTINTLPKKGSPNLRYTIAWCYGAPGIGLSRLRAYQLLHDEKYLDNCKASIRTSIKLIRQQIDTQKETDFSLCHGLTGICEFLLYAYTILGDYSYKSIAVDVAIEGVRRYVNHGLPWPCGIPTGESLDLMLGLAGIGYFYLRLHDLSTVQSPLMLSIIENNPIT